MVYPPYVILYLYYSRTPCPSVPYLPLPWQPQACSLHLWVYFWLVDRFICAIIPHLRFHMCDVIRHLSLTFWFTSLSTIICSCIHVAANGIVYFLWLSSIPPWASLVTQLVKNLPAIQETLVQSLGLKDPLEKEMATHSSTVAWEIPRKRSLADTKSWTRLSM